MSGILVNEGGPDDNRAIPLATKRGNWIRNVRKLSRAPQSMQAAERYAHRQVPGITTRTLASDYNCMGLIFASRRTVIDTEELDLIRVDDEYTRLNQKVDLKIGDLVVYRTTPTAGASHIGIVFGIHHDLVKGEIGVTVVSQWGLDGEFVHEEAAVPALYGAHLEYFTDRKSP